MGIQIQTDSLDKLSKAFEEYVKYNARDIEFLAVDHWDVVPDAVTLAKPLGGGLPLSAVVARSEMLQDQPLTASALAGSPAPCAAGVATLEVIENESLMARAAEIGGRIRDGLTAIQASSNIVGDVRDGR